MRLPLESLVYELPDDILKARFSGDIERAKELIDARLLKTNITPMLARPACFAAAYNM